MSLIDKAVAHYSKECERSIYIDEWDETVFAKNLSLEDRASLMSKSQDNSTEYLVYAVIKGIVNESAEPVFNIGDKPKLMRHVDPDIVVRLANFVLKVDTDPKA